MRLLESVHIDNMKILKALIYAKDDQLPLFDGSTKKRVRLFFSSFSLFYSDYIDVNPIKMLVKDHPVRGFPTVITGQP